MTELHHYCIFRKDLPSGVLVAQCIHAAGESNPEKHHAFAVALWAKDEEHLSSLEARLLDASLPHVAIREIDPPYNGELVAIGIQPSNRKTNKPLRRIVAGLPLIKEMNNGNSNTTIDTPTQHQDEDRKGSDSHLPAGEGHQRNHSDTQSQ